MPEGPRPRSVPSWVSASRPTPAARPSGVMGRRAGRLGRRHRIGAQRARRQRRRRLLPGHRLRLRKRRPGVVDDVVRVPRLALALHGGDRGQRTGADRRRARHRPANAEPGLGSGAARTVDCLRHQPGGVPRLRHLHGRPHHPPASLPRARRAGLGARSSPERDGRARRPSRRRPARFRHRGAGVVVRRSTARRARRHHALRDRGSNDVARVVGRLHPRARRGRGWRRP